MWNEVNECSGYPRHNDEHAAGDVDGDQVVGELTLEYKLNLQAAVFPWSSNLVNNRCIYIVLLKLVSVYSVYILPSTTLTWILIKEKLLGVQKENSFNFRQTQKVIMPHISASHLWILKMEHFELKRENTFNRQFHLSHRNQNVLLSPSQKFSRVSSPVLVITLQ